MIMLMFTLNNIQKIGTLLDFLGAIVIAAGVIISTGAIVLHFVRHMRGQKLYDGYRKDLARSILLGLEFLVAGDIIRTVTGTISIASVIALAGIVLIRSFLTLEFEMEITGKLPWQRKIKRVRRRKKPSKFTSKRKR